MYASYACVHADVWFRDICPFARQIAHHVFRLFDHALNKSGTPLVAKFVRREQVRVFNDPSHGYLIDHRAALAVRAVTGDTNTARAFREALNARDAGNAEGDDHAHAN